MRLVVLNWLSKQKDEQEAVELLRLFDEEYRSSAVCPKCGSNSIELVPKRTTANMVTAISKLVIR